MKKLFCSSFFRLFLKKKIRKGANRGVLNKFKKQKNLYKQRGKCLFPFVLYTYKIKNDEEENGNTSGKYFHIVHFVVRKKCYFTVTRIISGPQGLL